jgi:hypothetical protein
MIPRKLSHLTALIIGLLTLASPLLARTWTSAEGKSLEAELIEYDAAAGTVKIKRKDAKEFTLKKATLSEEDIAHLDELETAKQEALEAAKAKAASLAGKTTSHTSSGEQKVPFHIHFPNSYDGSKKLPMLILFSPGGGGKGMIDKFKDAAEAMEWVLVGCDKFKNGMKEDLGDLMFTELLPDIEKTVEHDSEYLYLGGFSGGGMRSFDYSAKFKRPWKGIISCGGWLGGPGNWDQDYTKNMAVAMVNGDGDKAANSWVDKDTDVLKRFKCKARKFEFPGGHAIAPTEILLEAMKWIVDEQE